MKMELDGTHVDQLDLDTAEQPVYTELDPPEPLGPAAYRKAIVALAGAVGAAVILWFPDLTGTVEKVLFTLDLILTPVFVYLIPNQTGGIEIEVKAPEDPAVFTPTADHNLVAPTAIGHVRVGMDEDQAA